MSARRVAAGIEHAFYRALVGLRPPKVTIARCGVVGAIVGVLSAAHYLGGANFGLYAFFVLPCALAAWSIGQTAGMLAATASTAAIFVSDLWTLADASASVLAFNAVLRLGLYALVAWGVATIGRLLERLDELSRTDVLTGLANRRDFLSRGDDEIERSRRTLRPFSVLYLDLDGFKSVNDKLGHARGDELLGRVAGVLKAQSRSIDVPARMGGDEFAVLLPETDGNGASRAARKLLENLRSEFLAVQCAVSASIGAATFLRPPASFDQALRIADHLMYEVKRGSKDAVIQRDFVTTVIEDSGA